MLSDDSFLKQQPNSTPRLRGEQGRFRLLAEWIPMATDRISDDEIEQLLRQAQQGQPTTPAVASRAEPAPAAAATATAPPPAASLPAASLPVDAGRTASTIGDDVNLLLAKAEAAIASIDAPALPKRGPLTPFTFESFGGTPPTAEQASLELLRDVELDLKIELGRTHMELEEVLKLRRGSVVPLDKLAGDPVDIFVNGRLVARGEVLVLNDNFCVRVAELVAGNKVA